MNRVDFKPSGISGLRAVEPVGAVVTIGIKTEITRVNGKQKGGNPTEKDRFHILLPQADDDRRDHHPAFEAFNGAAVASRKRIYGRLVHASPADTFEHYLRNHMSEGQPQPATGEPFCKGNGVKAVRYYGEREGFKMINCPNSECPFQKMEKPDCKPFMRFMFRIEWPADGPFAGLPTPLCKLTSRSWFTTQSFAGFFNYINNQAAAMGVENPNFYGLPFTLELTEQTQRAGANGTGRRFPVLTITPQADILEFLWKQRQKIAGLSAAVIPALPLHADQDAVVINADVRAITPDTPDDDGDDDVDEPEQKPSVMDSPPADPLNKKRVPNLIAAYAKIGVSRDALEQYLGCWPEMAKKEQIEELERIGRDIKAGKVKASDHFTGLVEDEPEPQQEPAKEEAAPVAQEAEKPTEAVDEQQSPAAEPASDTDVFLEHVPGGDNPNPAKPTKNVENVKKMLSEFHKLGVTVTMIEDRLGRPVEFITVEELTGFWTLRDRLVSKRTTVEKEFPAKAESEA